MARPTGAGAEPLSLSLSLSLSLPLSLSPRERNLIILPSCLRIFNTAHETKSRRPEGQGGRGGIQDGDELKRKKRQ